MNNSFWKPGSIVKLNDPYKPIHPDRPLYDAIAGNAMPSYLAYQAWQGFTHGFIAQVYGRDHQGNPTNVSLHLYDPQRHILYVEDFAHGIPSYVDFGIDELTPLKDGADIGYTPIG